MTARLRTYTVVGIWLEGSAYAVGASLGTHEVDGDTLDYTDMSAWSMVVEAWNFQDACECAVEKAEAENTKYNEGYGDEPEIVTAL